MAKTADNSATTAKKRIVGRPFTKNDPRINRNGAPRIGLSWKEILDEIGGLDGAEALERAGRIFAELKKYPNGVSLKELAAISYYIRMINDPNGSLLTAVADRTEGKVKDKLDITSNGETIGRSDEVRIEIQRKLARIANAGSTVEVSE